MTFDDLSELEEATLLQLENDIRVSFWVMVSKMAQIENERLYRADHATFSDWLLKRYPLLTANGKGISESTWRQWKASGKAYELAKTHGVELSNEHAARSLRQVQDSLRVLVINKTVDHVEMKTGERPARLTAAMINPVVKEIKAVIDEAAATGYVDDGYGSMSAFDAAVDHRLVEREYRRKQHLIDGAQKRSGWSEPVEVSHYWESEQVWFTFNGKDVAVPDGDDFEIRWRVVEEDPEQAEQESWGVLWGKRDDIIWPGLRAKNKEDDNDGET